MGLQLFVKINGEYKELSAVAIGSQLGPLFKTYIYVSIGCYIKECSSKKSRCTRTNEKKYFTDLYEFLKSQNVYYMDEITKEVIFKYKCQLLKKVAPATVNRQFNTIKNFFNIFTKRMQIASNPCIEIKHEKTEKPKINLWTVEDFEAVKNQLDQHSAKILDFMWHSGARNIEAVDLTWADIDYSLNNIKLRSRKNADHFRFFPMSDSISKILHTIDMKGPYVFGGGSKFTSDSLGKKVKKAVLACANNKSITVYGIRHTFCRDLLAKGLSRPVIQELMGHKDWRTTENYAHWDIEFLKKAANSVR